MMRMLYAVLVVGGLLGAFVVRKARRATSRLNDLGTVSDQWRADVRMRGNTD